MDERFLIEPYFKRAHVWRPQNQTGMVRDGVILTDTLTGARRHYTTRRDAKVWTERILADEAALDFTVFAGWHANLSAGGSVGIVEVRGIGTDGRDRGQLCLVMHSADADESRAHIAAWLQAMGHPALPEL